MHNRDPIEPSAELIDLMSNFHQKITNIEEKRIACPEPCRRTPKALCYPTRKLQSIGVALLDRSFSRNTRAFQGTPHRTVETKRNPWLI